jgi:hypothetical protein
VNTSQADTIVSGAVLGVLVMGMADDYVIKDENPSFKFFLAIAVTGATLAYIADVQPEVAAWLAIIIFVVVLMEEGAPVLKALQNSETAGQITPSQGKGGIEDFPVIPFTKKKGKKVPRPVTRLPALLPVKVKQPAPAREPIRINLKKFPLPIFSPIPGAGNSREAEEETPSGQRIKIPWGELEKGTAVAAGGVSAAAIAKGVVEFFAASADEVFRPVG